MEVVLNQKDQRGVLPALLKDLDLEQVLNRDVEHLSGVSWALLPPLRLLTRAKQHQSRLD